MIKQKESAGIQWESNGKVAGFGVLWLDASAYMLRDKINSWLDEIGIAYEHKQTVKWFLWEFEDEANVTLFMLRWV